MSPVPAFYSTPSSGRKASSSTNSRVAGGGVKSGGGGKRGGGGSGKVVRYRLEGEQDRCLADWRAPARKALQVCAHDVGRVRKGRIRWGGIGGGRGGGQDAAEDL